MSLYYSNLGSNFNAYPLIFNHVNNISKSPFTGCLKQSGCSRSLSFPSGFEQSGSHTWAL